MMYFSTQPNEQLSDILRTTIELLSQIESYSKNLTSDEYPANEFTDMSDTLNKMVLTLGDILGRDIVNQALTFKKENIK